MNTTIRYRSVVVKWYDAPMRMKRTPTAAGTPVIAKRGNKVVDARVRRSRETVLGVTAELLFERGLAGASVDEITRRSGVAKTTIYRHWPNRNALIIDACLRMTDGDDEPPARAQDPRCLAEKSPEVRHVLAALDGDGGQVSDGSQSLFRRQRAMRGAHERHAA